MVPAHFFYLIAVLMRHLESPHLKLQWQCWNCGQMMMLFRLRISQVRSRILKYNLDASLAAQSSIGNKLFFLQSVDPIRMFAFAALSLR